MNTQYKKNLKDAMTACKNYTDKRFEDFKWELGSHTLDVESDTTTAYSKSVPSGAIGCQINKLGGMSYKSENLLNIENGSVRYSSVTFTFLNGVCNSSGTPSQTGWIRVKEITLSAGTYSFKDFTSGSTKLSVINASYQDLGSSFTLSDTSTIHLGVTGNAIQNAQLVNSKPMLVSGNTAPTEFKPYFEGIRDSAVTSVVSKDSNDTTLDTLTIPAEVQALEGYGWGVNSTCYNYIYYEVKKFLKKVNKYTFTGNESFITLATGTEGWVQFAYTPSPSATNESSNVVLAVGFKSVTNAEYQSVSSSLIEPLVYHYGTGYRFVLNATTIEQARAILQGKTFYYELATPVETDISEYIEDNIIEVEPNGTLTFTNTYNQAVPSEIDYLIEEVKA